jgi:hypothetical protein
MFFAGFLLCLIGGFKQRFGPLIVIAGLVLLICGAFVYSTGIDLDAGVQRAVPSGAIDENTLDYNLTFVNYSVHSESSVLFLYWAFLLFGIFFMALGVYLSVADIG